MIRMIYSMVILAILRFPAMAQNNAVNFIQQLRKDNPDLYSGFKGAFTVGETGAAQYDLPFTVTAGVGGLTPQISVTYNSNSNSSILGEGWSLNGLTYITRTGSTEALDGFTQPVLFNDEDHLQIDGQRLIPLSEEGILGSVYYTENQTFKRVTVERNSGVNNVNGIRLFKVEAKDGLEYYYGDLQNMKTLEGLSKAEDDHSNGIVYTRNKSTGNIPFIWLVTLIRDKNNNWIYFKYNLDNNYYSPDEIYYGGSDLSAIGRIKFNYEWKNRLFGQVNPVNWSRLQYMRGEAITLNRPLASIVAYYKTPGATKERLVREYNFDYELDPVSNKLLLQQIFQSTIGHLDKDNKATYTKKISDKVNAITFDWHKAPGKSDFSPTVTYKDPIILEEDYKIAMADFNADGFPDKVLHRADGKKVNVSVALNDRTGRFLAHSAVDTFATPVPLQARSFTGDFNADGANDLLYVSSEANKLCLYTYYSIPSPNAVTFREVAKRDVLSLPAIELKKINFGAGDMNADGRTDLLIYYMEKDQLIYQGVFFMAGSLQVGQSRSHPKGNIPADSYIPQTTDINGDGVTDLLFTWTDDKGWYIKSFMFHNSEDIGFTDSEDNSDDKSPLYQRALELKLPAGMSYAEIIKKLESGEWTQKQLDSLMEKGTNQTLAEGDYTRLNNIMTADINRDGNMDLTISYTGLDGWVYYCAMGRGDGTFGFQAKTIITDKIKFLYNHKSGFGDFNGDGNLDMIIQKSDADGWQQIIAWGNGQGRFQLTKADAGFETLINRNFTYSQRYITDYVLPYCASHLFGLIRIFDDGRIKRIVPCEGHRPHACLLHNIRRIFPVETGFYPHREQRPYQAPMADPVNNFIQRNLNPEQNIKRIVFSDYTLDSLTKTTDLGFCSTPYYYYTKLTYGDYWQPYVIDLNGDGTSDLLLTYPRQIPNDTVLKAGTNELESGLFTFTVLNTHTKNGFIKDIRHSNKSMIHLEYRSVMEMTASPPPPTPVNYPNLACHAPIYTVSKVGVTNGLSGQSLNYTGYAYFNGIVNLSGRGLAGFEHVRITNLQNNNHTDKRYWVIDSFLAYGSMPLRSTETFIDGITTPISTESFEHAIVKHPSVDKVYNTYNVKRSSGTYDLTGVQTSFNDGNFVYDEWGNLIRSVSRRGLGQDEISSTVVNTYYETTEPGWVDTDKWLLGRLKSTEITTTRGTRSSKRKSIFEYNRQTGQLTKEVSDVDAVAAKLSLTKQYRHNKYGNIVESIVFPTYDNNANLIKKTITDYTADQRFVETTTDAGGYVHTKNTDPLLGLVTQLISGDRDNRTATVPDEFGRTQRAVTPEGLETRTELRICKQCDTIPATYFSIETTSLSNFTLPTVTYFDNTGKTVRKVTFDHQLRKIIIDYHYDTFGNLAGSTYPYFEHQPVYTTTFRYDKINRRVLTTLPDSSRLTIVYQGLTEKSVNDKNQQSISFKNTVGELVRSIDNDSFFLSYAYDEFGRVIAIQDKDNRTYSMEYDINGNRTFYLNPNFSKPELATFDAFSRKIRTVSPMDWEKTFLYDPLDRLLMENANRPGFKHRFIYNYIQQADADAGKGKLRAITSDADDHPFNERYTYNPQGQLLTRTYEVRKGSWLYEKNKFFEAKNKLTFDFGYTKGQLTRLVYPATGVENDKLRLTVQYTYDNGTLVAATGNIDKRSIPFWRLKETNAMGTATAYQLGDSVMAHQVFDPVINNINMMGYTTGKDTIAGMRYGYDRLGNLVMRQDLTNPLSKDSLYYDNLNRVINVVTNGYITTIKYLQSGDVLSKQFGREYLLNLDYKAGTNRINTITLSTPNTATPKITQTVKYDAYGNQEMTTLPYLLDGKTKVNIEYNQFNLPYHVGDMRFFYSYDGSRAALYNEASNEGNIFLGTLTEYKHDLDYKDILRYQKMNILVNGTVVANYFSNNGQVQFLLKDAQHTVIALADNKGKILSRYAYDIWGMKRNPADWKYVWKELKKAETAPDERGFLNNISLAGYGLSDMNARLYDPVTGRFIAVDPITSNALARTQFANSYHYGYNNPTAFIDANGKFGVLAVVAIGAFIGASAAGGSLLPWEWNENWWKGALVGGLSAAGGYFAAPAVFTAGATVTPGMIFASGAAAGFAGGFTSTLVNGGNFAQALENGLKGGIVGGVTATITFGIGEYFGNNPNFLSGNYFAKASLHGINQGIASEAMGGSFEHGFLAGAFASMATPFTNMPNTSPSQRTVLSAMVGGTASSLGGGKFANGAVSGAMMQIYNENQTHPNGPNKDDLLTICTPDESICTEGSLSFGFAANASMEGDLGVSFYPGWGGGVSVDLKTMQPTFSVGFGIGGRMRGYESIALPGCAAGVNFWGKNGLFASCGGFGINGQLEANLNFSNMMNTGARAMGELTRQFENWVLHSQPNFGR